LWAAEEAGTRHDHVLAALDKLMAELPVSVVGPNFRPNDYLTKNGRISEAGASELRERTGSDQSK
jgi:hypothetical protein